MTSREDAIFDDNKYYFPEGAAKIREQRLERASQPWLEVSAPRDEQGTPGLQLVPDEQKYVSRNDNKGLYGECSAPAFLATHNSNNNNNNSGFSGTAQAPDLTGDHHHQVEEAPQIDAILQQPWSQPVTPQRSQHWAERSVTSEQIPRALSITPEVADPYARPVSAPVQQPVVEPAQQAWPPPAILHQPQWSQSQSQGAPSIYPERNYWTPPVDEYGNLSSQYPVSHSYSSLAASSSYSGSNAWDWSYGASSHPVPSSGADVPLMKEDAKPQSPKWSLAGLLRDKQRVRYVLLGMFGGLIVVGAILGGYFGRQAARNKADAAAGHSSSPTGDSLVNGNTTATVVTTIRRNSRLAVTGWRASNNANSYTLRLFYQDPDHRIRYMDKSSETQTWTDPVVLDTLEYEPNPNGSIATGVWLDHNTIVLFYLDTTSTIRGQTFDFYNQNGIPPKGASNSINDYPQQTAQDSSMGAYFPYVVTQDSVNSSEVRWTKMPMAPQSATSPEWVNDTSIDIAGSPGTDMVLLPISQSFLDNGGFVYRDAGGQLQHAKRDYNNNSIDYSWDHGMLSTPVPAGSAIGAFVVGRPYTAEDINTYILYQDSSGNIQVVWQDSDDWQGPQTFDALANAEAGTDIECLTEAAWEASDRQVSREQDMNRCFFQEKDTNRLKEVWYNGTDWNDMGYVPLD